jgi:hypothetical protein
MPRFSFQIQKGKFSEAPAVETELDGPDAAWREGLDICADLVREIVQTLSPTEPEWRVAVADEAGKPLYRFRVIGEAVK